MDAVVDAARLTRRLDLMVWVLYRQVVQHDADGRPFYGPPGLVVLPGADPARGQRP